MQFTHVLYVLVMLICTFFTSLIPNRCFKLEKNKILYYLYLIIPITIYTVFWGLRYNVGADYLNYIDLYVNYEYYSDIYEKGYILLCYIINSFGFSYIAIFVVTSFLNIFLLYVVFRNESSKFATFSIFFYYTTSLCFFAQNGLRQMLAINVVILTLYTLKYYRLTTNVLVLLVGACVGFLFHKSCIFPFAVLLLLLIVPLIKINNKIIILTYVVLFICSASFNFNLNFFYGIFDSLGYGRNLERINDEILISSSMLSSFSIGNLIKQSLVLIIFAYQDVFVKKKSPQYYCYMFVVLGSFFSLLIKGLIANRMFIYFNYMTFLVMAYLCCELIKQFKENRNLKSKIVYHYIIVSYFILYCYYILSNNNLCVPYIMVEF